MPTPSESSVVSRGDKDLRSMDPTRTAVLLNEATDEQWYGTFAPACLPNGLDGILIFLSFLS